MIADGNGRAHGFRALVTVATECVVLIQAHPASPLMMQEGE
jgi:hypothetical protein